MCGIAGVRRFDGAPVTDELLAAMIAYLGHRGPDDAGTWTDGATGFGHRRLSIIDLDGSRQPMRSADGRAVITFNGEIFNYPELRRRSRYPFRTNGDTEVLLALHQEHGTSAVDRLRGQFAYAIADRADGSLLLVRDRLGVLPLYYYVDQQVFGFASEIKALLPALPRHPEVDEDSLRDYLAHRSVPAPATLFRGVRKVPPAHWLRVDAAGHVELQRYWSLPGPEAVEHVTDDEAVRRVGRALEDAVAASLVADVPVGAYLSGGIDSSLVVALIAKQRGGHGLQTFSAGFGDPRFDELPHARRVSQLFDTDHHEVTVTPADFEASWHDLTWHRDAPLSEPADVAVHKLAVTARREVKVVLSGEGSDELFAGYPKHRLWPAVAAAEHTPASLRRALSWIAERSLPTRAGRARIALRALGASEDELLRAWFAPFTEAERDALLGGRDRGTIQPLRLDRSRDMLSQMLAADCQAWLADNLLERGDRMSMAASLELRPPFLDKQVVELAFSLPSSVKVRRGTTKWVMKEVARRHLPTDIVDRRKVGFRVPLEAWFRGDLQTTAWDLLAGPDSFVSQVFDRDGVRRLLRAHARGRRNEDIRIWTLLCLEVWHDVFFRTTPPAPPPRSAQHRPTILRNEGS